MRDTRYWLWLSTIPGIGSKRLMELVNYFGSAENVFECSRDDLIKSGLLGEKAISAVILGKSLENIDYYLKSVKENNVKVYTIHDSEYPDNLKLIHDPPPIIYVKGELKKEDNFAIGIVGSRKASDYGLKAAGRIAARLAELGITIVSGMALGIDSAAHNGALQGRGRTIAVLGCGLKNVYPKSNTWLSRDIVKNGALISEYPLDTEAMAQYFPARNRIISGLSLGVIVVEAGEKSGSLITADFALEQGREVFAVPGNISSPNSKGTNALIQNGAKLVSSIEDILEELNLNIIYNEKKNINNNEEMKDIGKEEKAVLDSLKTTGRNIDEIIRATGLTAGKVMSAITKLELKELIQQNEGYYYTT
ncbi:MAG: DNA-processing protein DprA [Caulobacteraceae bacterium]